MFLVHAGNRLDLGVRTPARFPRHRVPEIRGRIATVLADLRPEGLITAPAAGADLIVIETALQLGIAAHVVIPIATPDFVAESVSDHGQDWVDTYYRVMEQVLHNENCTVEMLELPFDDDVWQHGNEIMVQRTAALAETHHTSVMALTIRPLPVENPPSGTDDLALRAVQRGWPVITIDPRPADVGWR